VTRQPGLRYAWHFYGWIALQLVGLLLLDHHFPIELYEPVMGLVVALTPESVRAQGIVLYVYLLILVATAAYAAVLAAMSVRIARFLAAPRTDRG
jgi:hypothetical protein